MQVVLLERVDKLGRMGEVVTVRDGFARNFLLPRKKALRATAENIAQFERERAALETRNSERKTEAGGLATKLEGQAFVVIRQAGDSGQLYGSVSPRDIADTINATGYSLTRTDVQLDHPIKALGLHGVTIVLHPEVKVTVTINVARSPDEAAKQARGESVIGARTEEEEVELEAIFDSPEASHKAQETEGEEDEAAGS